MRMGAGLWPARGARPRPPPAATARGDHDRPPARDSCSHDALRGKDQQEGAHDDESGGGIPGFTAMLAISAVIGALIFTNRRIQKRLD